MYHKIKVGKLSAKHKRENQKKFAHKEIKTSEMKRCWINPKTFILIPIDADEEQERKKYLDNHEHYHSLYDSYGGRTKKS